MLSHVLPMARFPICSGNGITFSLHQFLICIDCLNAEPTFPPKGSLMFFAHFLTLFKIDAKIHCPLF